MESVKFQKMKTIITILILHFFGCVSLLNTCDLRTYFDAITTKKICISSENLLENTIYLLYDVNQVEGFNLRRDVYIRMAVLINNLKKKSIFRNVKLVLPPFPHLYHWRSSHIDQDKVFWNHFFDMNSLRTFAPVLDFYEFVNEFRQQQNSLLPSNKIEIENVIQLQHFEDMFANGVFTDKFEFNDKCLRQELNHRPLLGYDNVTECKFFCLKFQGSSILLENVLKIMLKRNIRQPTSVLFLNAEIVLHDQWGNKQYWQARRSMRFNSNLVAIADLYRKNNFNSTNEFDLVQRPNNWIHEKKYRAAKGGEYLCGHIRRADFVYGRENTTPTLKSVANQIRSKLNELKLNKVFVSSDCSKFEFKNLKSYLGRTKVYRFFPESIEQKNEIKDGGQAIIDQIICSNARYFIGTYESTFTYRIYEEREILGFPMESTFNTFCKNEDLSNCERNSVWPIVY